MKKSIQPSNTYSAFLSYSCLDNQRAQELHIWLEKFVVPKSLRQHIDGKNRLAPIFRDQEEFAASRDLGQLIKTTLDNSNSLVVLCSESSVNSNWVEEEVDYFVKTKNSAPIVCVLIGSEELSIQQILPSAFLGKGKEPLAVDMRTTAWKNRKNKLRIVAGILGVGINELVRRHRTRKIYQSVVIAVSAVVLSGVEWCWNCGRWFFYWFNDNYCWPSR